MRKKLLSLAALASLSISAGSCYNSVKPNEDTNGLCFQYEFAARDVAGRLHDSEMIYKLTSRDWCCGEMQKIESDLDELRDYVEKGRAELYGRN